jgi:hypothetical protein
MKPWFGSVEIYISLHIRNANSLRTGKFAERFNVVVVGNAAT